MIIDGLSYQEMIDQVKEIINSQEPHFLEVCCDNKGKESYICPVCGNGSGESGTGLTTATRKRVYSCHGKCGGKTYDVIDLFAAHYDLSTSESNTYKKCYAYYGITTHAPKGKFSKAGTCSYEIDPEKATLPDDFELYSVKRTQEHITEKTKDFESYIRQAAANNDFKYLLSRGISEKTQRKFFIGYDDKWIHPNCRDSSNVYPTQRCIIPTSIYSYLARDTKPGSKNKMKVGKTHIFNFILHLIRKPKPRVFVTEGEIDALSVEEMGYPAIGLGSAEMAVQFCDVVNKFENRPDFIFLPDGDEAGERALSVLRKRLVENAFAANDYVARCGYHDPNDFLVNDRDGFSKFLKECYERPEKLEPLHKD